MPLKMSRTQPGNQRHLESAEVHCLEVIIEKEIDLSTGMSSWNSKSTTYEIKYWKLKVFQFASILRPSSSFASNLRPSLHRTSDQVPRLHPKKVYPKIKEEEYNVTACLVEIYWGHTWDHGCVFVWYSDPYGSDSGLSECWGPGGRYK